MSNTRFPSIGGLRAISIALVIFSHLDMRYSLFESWRSLYSNFIIDIITEGSVGVNIFFVISGFLITSLLLQEEINTAKVSLKNFYIRRTLRIFPAYFFMLFVYFILQLSGYIDISKMSWLTALTYTKYFKVRDWYTGHLWSLTTEENFYLFWPLIFKIGKKLRSTIAVSLVLIVPCIRVFLRYHPNLAINELSIFTRVDSISLGCLAALHKDAILKIFDCHWNAVIWSSIIIYLGWNILWSICLHYQLHVGSIFGPFGITHGTVANIAIALMMMYCIYGPRKLLYKFLNSGILNYIGILSYSIYLWQQFFLYGASRWYNQFPVNLLCLAVAATASYYLIEKPFLRLKSKF